MRLINFIDALELEKSNAFYEKRIKHDVKQVKVVEDLIPRQLFFDCLNWVKETGSDAGSLGVWSSCLCPLQTNSDLNSWKRAKSYYTYLRW
jgi:hypothetical protein